MKKMRSGSQAMWNDVVPKLSSFDRTFIAWDKRNLPYTHFYSIQTEFLAQITQQPTP